MVQAFVFWDLTENRLIETSEPPPYAYVCLISYYIWGKSPVIYILTLNGNIDAIKAPGSLLTPKSRFPKSIRHAMAVARHLN